MVDFNNITPEKLRELKQNPLYVIYTELAQKTQGGIVNPELQKAAFEWTRTTKQGDPGFDQPIVIKGELVILGLLNADDSVNHALIPIAREYIKSHIDENPNYLALWQYLQTHMGQISKRSKTPDYQLYSEKIALMIDQGTNLLDMCDQILQFEKSDIEVPIETLYQASRAKYLKTLLPENQHSMIEEELEKRNINWFPADNVMWEMRNILKDKNYGLGETELQSWLDDQGKPSAKRQFQAFFGQRNKFNTLKDLQILDRNGKWSELGFQHFQQIMAQLTAENEPPSLERLRFEIWRHFHPNDPIAFEWLLLNDNASKTEIHKTKRLASIALSGGILGDPVKILDDINKDQYEFLRKFGGWLYGAFEIKHKTALHWLGQILYFAETHFDWERWRQICGFIYDKIDDSPEPELISDWLSGIVTFEGYGLYQKKPIPSFGESSTKIGRNDPCPCGSGKKYKKCCGR